MKLVVQLLACLTTAVVLAQDADHATTGRRDGVSKIVFEALVSRGLLPEELPTTLDLSALPSAGVHQFRVEHVSWDAVRRVIQIRLQSEAAKPCLPVLLQARVPQAAERSIRAKLAENHQRPGEAETKASRPPRGHGPILVEAGKPATLFWQANALRVSTPVICLRNGRNGDRVPVRTREGKRLLRAQVVGAGTVAMF